MPLNASFFQIQKSPSELDQITIQLTGDWVIGNKLPIFDKVIDNLKDFTEIECIVVSGLFLGEWDSRLIVFLLKLIDYCHKQHTKLELQGMPEGVHDFLKLANAVPERHDARKQKHHEKFLEKVGNESLEIARETQKFLAFTGEACLSMSRLLRGKSRFRSQDFY